MARKRVSVISQSRTGRNEKFRDNYTGKVMTRTEFVNAISNGAYSNYHVRDINSVKTPVSNPDGRSGNNLG